MRSFALCLLMLATPACGGVLDTSDSGAEAEDAAKDASSPSDGAGFDAATFDGTTAEAGCSGTVCGSSCVDTSSDSNNCGGCGIVCDSGSCTNAACDTGKIPPSGSCAHSLCQIGSPLEEDCDPTGCTTTICDSSGLDDSYCCETTWDNTCLSEVDQYCAPYSCN